MSPVPHLNDPRRHQALKLLAHLRVTHVALELLPIFLQTLQRHLNLGVRQNVLDLGVLQGPLLPLLQIRFRHIAHHVAKHRLAASCNLQNK